MKKALMVIMAVVVCSAVSHGAIVQVPWNDVEQRYYLKWQGYTDINSGNYDPDVISGTYQKQNGDKWIATSWAANYGRWKYQFVGGPNNNLVESVTVNVYCSQAGQLNWHYGHFATDPDGTWSKIYELPSGQARALDWRGATFGSPATPVNADTIYVRDTIWNGWYSTAVLTSGMEVIGTPIPEPATLALLGLGGLLLGRRR